MTNAELLSQLHAEMRLCRSCIEEGYSITPPAIFSGISTARIMIIGQAPGITEVEARRPFNAGSGSRLFQWLAEVGIDENWFRQTQYMTSVTKCFPGKANAGGGDRVPSRFEQNLCRPFLDQEIFIVNPHLIIPIGRLAIELFYSKRRSLSDIIGTEKQINHRWIIPLPHPSGASRWHQIPENRERISRALLLIQRHFTQIFSKSDNGQ